MILIAGPCVLEDESTVFQTFEFLIKHTKKYNIEFFFKSSIEEMISINQV